ncbi:MAG TPA: AMP-binding protein [Amycolatopsis sp.]|nr:AMP-binding protein [Amycolatopsis sp.]HVV10465.1 AMP-binding protein [Amycolatopsis sp.]
MSTTVSRAELSPIRFLLRAASVWADRTAVVDGNRTWTYAGHLDRVEALAGALGATFGTGAGDRVATLLANVAPMLEAHYAVPGLGAVLVPLNTRLTAADYRYILEHSGAAVVIADRAFAPALAPVADELPGLRILWTGDEGYEDLLAKAARRPLSVPADENALISINYTSGTTGRPKGVMTTHRGAYLHTLGVLPEAMLTPSSAYLWTLPMFHCNGWAYTWAVTAAGGTHVCLPKVEGKALWEAMDRHRVTHLCAAPTVLSTLLTDPAAHPVEHPVQVFVGGAPPAPALIERAQRLGIAVTHLYGLTETYGPLAVCAWNPDWDALDAPARSRLRARQGVGTIVSEPLRVVDKDMRDVPADAATMGEVVMRGNNVMLGYYRDEAATAEAFRGGWFHSGDLAVLHPDGYIELRDRAKDVIISGGENISTIEVEQALAAHPAVVEVAVVAAPDERWGEVPVAFVITGETRPGAEELIEFARERIARFKVPKRIEFVTDLPRTGTGKIQKFRLRERAADRPT